GSQTRTVVPVEILKEQEAILPMGIRLELFRTTVHRSPPGFVPQEDTGQTVGDLLGHLKKVHQLARACWTLDLEVVPVIKVKGQQRTDKQRIHRHPDGPAPVGVTAEHTSI